MAKNSPSRDGVGSRAQNQIYILVLGAVGSGKSTLVNRLSGGGSMEVGDNQDPCTTEIKIADISCPNYTNVIPQRLQACRISIVDTPGFNNPNHDDHQISYTIAAWLAKLRQDGKTLGAVLYLYDLSDDRITGSEKSRMKTLRLACGKEAMRGTILVTTKSCRMDPHRAAAEKENDLKTKHWAELIKNGAKVVRFDDDDASGSKILNVVFNNFINGPGALNLDIQKDLVENGLTFDQTNAGRYSASRQKESEGIFKKFFRLLKITR